MGKSFSFSNIRQGRLYEGKKYSYEKVRSHFKMTKYWNRQEVTTLVNLIVPKNKASDYTKQNLTELQEKTKQQQSQWQN